MATFGAKDFTHRAARSGPGGAVKNLKELKNVWQSRSYMVKNPARQSSAE